MGRFVPWLVGMDNLSQHGGNQSVIFWTDFAPDLDKNLGGLPMSRARQIGAQVYIAGMALAAVGCLVFAFLHRHPTDPAKFAFYLVAAVVASSLKVSLPGVEGTMSMNFLLTLLCILELGLPETLLIGLVKTLAQFYWRPSRQLKLVQLLFNLSQVTVCSAATWAHTNYFQVTFFMASLRWS